MAVFKPIGSNTNYPNYSNLGLIEFTNPIYGSNLAQNPGFTGTPDNIHNGTDSVLWTATNIVKNQWIFNSTTQAHTGTRSIDGTTTTDTATMLLTRASVINTGSYSVLAGWIYITSWDNPQNGTRDIKLQLRNSGTTLGQEVGVLSYIEPNNLNVWQQFVIPITDFTPLSVDFNEITIETIDEGEGAPPDFYLDDLSFQEGGGSIVFASAVPPGFSMRLEQFSVTFARATSQTTPVWDTILGKTLTNGIILQAWTPFGSANLGVFKKHVDWLFPPGLRIFYSHDGTNAVVTYEFDFTTPLTLNGNLNGQFRAIVQDDISDFLFAQCGARGQIVATEDL